MNGRNWKGGRYVDGSGYVVLWNDKYPRNKVHEHVLIAESALGKPLPLKAQIHHVNGIKTDNRKSNLLICENQHYHLVLHVKADRLRLFGSWKIKRCITCKGVMPLDLFMTQNARWDGKSSRCKSCDYVRGRVYRQSKKK